MRAGVPICPGSGTTPLVVYPINRSGKCSVCRQIQKLTLDMKLVVHGEDRRETEDSPLTLVA